MSHIVIARRQKAPVLTTLQERGAVLVPSTVDQRTELLDRTVLSTRLAWSQERAMAEFLSLFRLPQGTWLFREGDYDSFCAILTEGALEIRKQDGDERERVVANLRAGKMVGEMSLIDGAARSASAMAVKPSEILILTGEEFNRMGEQAPRLALTFALMIAEATANLLRRTTGALVDHLHAPDEAQS